MPTDWLPVQKTRFHKTGPALIGGDTMRPINMIVVHCSATPADMDIGAEEIDRWHKERGWAGIGYHAVIRRNGDIERGRDDGAIGAHARGHNTESLAVCMVGGLDENGEPETNFLPAQYESLTAVVANWRNEYGVKDENILGHRDLPGVKKACPCFDVRPWWAANKGAVTRD